MTISSDIKEQKAADKEETRRIADLHMQAQIPILSHRIGELERIVREKLNGYLDVQFEKLHNKLSDLKCGEHHILIHTIEDKINIKIDGMKTRINWMYFAFGIVVLGGVILKWMR